MPFTSYHLGLSLLLGYLLRRKFNWPTLILSSIIIDFEPLIVMVVGLNHPLHGLLHTFIASIPAGVLVGFILHMVEENMTPYLMDLALIDKKNPLKSFILAGVAGWASHVLLDSPLYPEMKPLFPLNINPMFQPDFHQIIFYAYALLFLAGVIIYPIHLYRALRNKDRTVAEVSVGLVSVGLGATSILMDMLCHAGFLLTVAGFFMLANGLKRIMPHLSKRLFFSFIMLAAASSLVYLSGLHMLGLVRQVFSVVFMGSYILSLAALAALWPALKLLRRNLGDHILSLSLNLLISGWILAPLLIPLFIAALSYAIILVRMPHKLMCLREKTTDPNIS